MKNLTNIVLYYYCICKVCHESVFISCHNTQWNRMISYYLLKFSQILYLSTFYHSILVWTLSTNLLMWAFLTCADCCCCSSLSRLVTKQSWNEMRDLQFTEKSVKLGNIFLFFLFNDLKKFSWVRSPLHYSVYAFGHCLVHGLFGLDPGRLVFITKKVV